MAFFFFVARSAMGDGHTPKYEFWYEKSKLDEFSEVSNMMIIICWGIWFMNSILTMIILMNFLIAVISSSYEKV